MNLRKHIATSGLKLSLESGGFGLPVELIAPDGTEIKTNEVGDKLKGQVLYDADGIDPESGDLIVVEETTVTLRITALSRVPLAGENWGVKIPVNPAIPDVLTQFIVNTDKSLTNGRSIGFIKLFLKDAEQI